MEHLRMTTYLPLVEIQQIERALQSISAPYLASQLGRLGKKPRTWGVMFSRHDGDRALGRMHMLQVPRSDFEGAADYRQRLRAKVVIANPDAVCVLAPIDDFPTAPRVPDDQLRALCGSSMHKLICVQLTADRCCGSLEHHIIADVSGRRISVGEKSTAAMWSGAVIDVPDVAKWPLIAQPRRPDFRPSEELLDAARELIERDRYADLPADVWEPLP